MKITVETMPRLLWILLSRWEYLDAVWYSLQHQARVTLVFCGDLATPQSSFPVTLSASVPIETKWMDSISIVQHRRSGIFRASLSLTLTRISRCTFFTASQVGCQIIANSPRAETKSHYHRAQWQELLSLWSLFWVFPLLLFCGSLSFVPDEQKLDLHAQWMST